MATKVQRSNMRQTDAKGKTLREPRVDKTSEAINFSWWRAPEEEMANQIVQTIRFMQRHQGSRNEQLVVSTRLYGNTSTYNLVGTSFTRANAVNTSPSSQRISFNLCASVIDTLTSMVAKNRVQPTFVTNGGTWGMQRKAENLTKFTEGLYYQHKLHSKTVDGFRDAAAWGTGIVGIGRYQDDVCIERVLPHEIVIDVIESIVASPRQIHRVKECDRGVAMAEWPEEAEIIADVQPAAYQDIGGGTTGDLITMTDSIHLPSQEDMDDKDCDGFRIICAGDKVIKKIPWKKSYFPYAFFFYSKRLLGFWGQGACERLQSLQGQINRLMMLQQQAAWLGGGFKILSHIGDKIPPQHFNNSMGPILKWAGDISPSMIAPPFIQAEISPMIDGLIAKGYQQEGVSQMNAASVKPLGVNSGKAMRTLNDIESDRFESMGQDFEDFNLEIVRQAIEVVKEIYEDKKTYKVMFPSTRFMETVDWKDIKLKKDEYVMKAFPTSSLADDMTGRLQDVQELAQAGYISPRTARKLLRMPDIEMADMLANAAEDLLHKQFEEMLDGAEMIPPEQFYDLTLGKQLALQYYNYAKVQNAPEEVLAVLRDWMEQADDILGLNKPPAPPSPITPPANAAPAPVSPMIPNVNPQAQAA